MGEYATRKSDGEHVKIGTCESMYYMRADQLDDITDPSFPIASPDVLTSTLFRFPFPDEDGTRVGGFDPYNRSAAVPEGWTLPADCEGHGGIQLASTTTTGWLAYLPCPQGPDAIDGVNLRRNGGQRYGVRMTKPQAGGTSRVVVECSPCGRLWSLTRADALALAAAYLDEGDRRSRWDGNGTIDRYYLEMASRIADLYGVSVVPSSDVTVEA